MQHKSFRLHTQRLGLGLALFLLAACTTQTTQVRQNPPPTAPKQHLQRYRIPLHKQVYISRGPQHAPIQIIEYLNPTHPHSQHIHQIRETLWKRFPGTVRWEVRLAPAILHDQGYLYARALLAAHRHNSFWPYLHRFFQHKTPPSQDTLFHIAEQSGLSKQLFELYLHFAPLKMWIDRDIRSLMAFTSPGTPTLFFNGAYLPPPYNTKRLLQAAQHALQESRALLEQGTPPHQIYTQLTQQGTALPTPQSYPEAVAQRQYTHLPFAYTEGIPYRGPGDAPVHIVEFSDFTCVPCRQAFLSLEKLIAAYPQHIRFYFKFYPIGIHAEGMRAAELAAAAQAQRKFWPIYSILFQQQQRLLRGELLSLAREVGMDTDWLSAELDRHSFQRRVQINAQQGRAIGVRGVPTIFFNGRILLQPQSYPYVFRVFQQELWKQGILLSKSP